MDLSAIVPEKGIDPGAALRILDVRRNILDRVFSQQAIAGRYLRHEAEAEQCWERIEKEGEKLTAHRLKDLRGRALEAQAKANLCIVKSVHYDMEIRAYLACLIDDKE